MYTRFIEIRNNSRPTDPLRFVGTALPTEPWFRTAIEHMFIEPSESDPSRLRAVGTDGKRLHIADPLPENPSDLCPGYWRVVRMTKTMIQLALNDSPKEEFPAYRNILPARKYRKKFSCTFPGLHPTNARERSHDVVMLLRAFPEITAIHFAYLEPLENINGGWSVEWFGPDRAVVFRAADRLAVIMPMAV